jgi:rod shape-determining protein MreD
MMNLNLKLILAFFIAFILTIIPLPLAIAGIRPPWILLVVLYVQFFFPRYFSITLLLFIGLCLDVLLATVIGEHAFALLMTTWIASGKVRRFGFFSSIQQMLLVAVFCLVYQLIIYLIDAFLGYNNRPWMVIGTALFSTFFWPWLQWALPQRRPLASRKLTRA